MSLDFSNTQFGSRAEDLYQENSVSDQKMLKTRYLSKLQWLLVLQHEEEYVTEQDLNPGSAITSLRPQFSDIP